ncbi:phage tail tape measure protein, partial [Streptomyces sp.]|uniref:phage tail tape measure protein n=1 Tax=Streptomyces sp. TaxID=1931 RepID=UPI002F4150A2
LGAVAQNLGGFANLSSKELGELTKDAEALAHTFEFDVAESTQAAGQLMKAGLAKDGGEAFDLITAAAQKLPPAMREEIPALTSEYSEFFRQLGFSGPEMFGLLAEAAKNPMFELDKLGDAVKEFTLLLADTGAVSEPLKELGLDVEHIQGLVDKGQGTRAFDEVTTALKNVENQTERTRLQAALFGGPGEDLGNTLLTISASSAAATSGMDDAAGATKKITDSMQASAAQAWESVMRSVTMTIGETLAPVLRLVADLLREHPGLIGAITPVVLAVAAALAVWAAAQWALNSALLANPMTWIILGIVALVAAIVVIATKTTWFQDMWAAAMDGVAAAWDWLWGLLQDGFKVLTWLFYHWPGPQLIIAHWDTIMDAVGAAIGWVNGKVASGMRWVLSAVGWLGALPGMAGRYFQGMANSAVTKTMALVDFVRSIPGRIRSALGDLGTLLLGAGRGIVQGLIDGITSKVGALRDQLGSITSMIPDWKGPMDVDMRLLTPSGEALMSGLMDGIAGQEPTLQRQLQAVTTSIPGNVTTGVARAAGGGGQGTVLEIASAGGAANDAILQLLLDAIRVRGGDPVEILTPRA